MVSDGNHVAFLLVPGYGMFPMMAAIEMMRMANQVRQQRLYSWTIHSPDGKAARSSAGLEIAVDGGLDPDIRPRTVFVGAGINPDRFDDGAAFAWLRRLERTGVAVGGLSTGAFVLARAGLLDGYRCTIHWESQAPFSEAFPHIELTNTVFEIDRNRYTSSGGTSSIDLMLHLIAGDFEPALASAISKQFQIDRIRDSADQQSLTKLDSLRVKSPKLRSAVRIMEGNIEDPLSLIHVAARLGITIRQLQRLFGEYLDTSPGRFYLELRLAHARQLLLQTAMPVIDVAVASGFTSHAHFSKCYRQNFGKSPTEERRGVL